MRIQFLGAARQVTGSRYLLTCDGLRLMVDCGLFQERAYLERNWQPSPVLPGSIDHLLLTHAHLDHCGLIPRLVRQGYRRPIHATAATRDLSEIILKDSAAIQAEDTAYKKKRHERESRKSQHPYEPLYTPDDVDAALALFQPVSYGRPIELRPGLRVTYHDAGHILGSAMIEVAIRCDGREQTILFSGDIGEWNRPIIRDPTLLERADYVVMESTYGDRLHAETTQVEDQLAETINQAVSSGGNVLIPTFAVERAQQLMYHISRLVRENRIPSLRVFLDSPMAVDVTEVFCRHKNLMDADSLALLQSDQSPLKFPGLKLVRESSESKAINHLKDPCIIMAGSGMCNAGRIKHHLVNNITKKECTVAFVGYQAVGTLGRELVDGKALVRIHGSQLKVRARIKQILGLSGHADQAGLLKWIGSLKSPPRAVFLTHGEQESAAALADLIRKKHGWRVENPAYQQTVELD